MPDDPKDNRNRVNGAEIGLGQQEDAFWIGSIFSGKTLEPVVEFQWDDKKVQMPSEKAMEMSWWMYEAATNALFDAFLYDFIINRVGGPPEKAGYLMAEFRDYREERRDVYQRGFQILDQVNRDNKPD
jgi:hypothetical protein